MEFKEAHTLQIFLNFFLAHERTDPEAFKGTVMSITRVFRRVYALTKEIYDLCDAAKILNI